MRRNWVLLFALIVLSAFACKKNETATSDTGTTTYATATSSTSPSATDTSGTTATTGTTATAAATTVAASDKDFANKAAEGGIMEVDLGQLAASKATSQDVKDFGNRMVTDHGKASDELKQLASNKGLTLPAQPGAEEKKTSDALSKKTGKDFDKAYISDMVKDHEKDAKEFEKASKDLKDPDLKAWASKTLTVVQDHLKMAKQIAGKLK